MSDSEGDVTSRPVAWAADRIKSRDNTESSLFPHPLYLQIQKLSGVEDNASACWGSPPEVIETLRTMDPRYVARTGNRCWYHHKTFAGVPVRIPMSAPPDGIWSFYGCFCSFECAGAFIHLRRHDARFSMERLRRLAVEVYGIAPDFGMAPEYTTQEEYGGPFNETTYTALLRTGNIQTMIEMPPFLAWPTFVHQIFTQMGHLGDAAEESATLAKEPPAWFPPEAMDRRWCITGLKPPEVSDIVDRLSKRNVPDPKNGEYEAHLRGIIEAGGPDAKVAKDLLEAKAPTAAPPPTMPRADNPLVDRIHAVLPQVGQGRYAVSTIEESLEKNPGDIVATSKNKRGSGTASRRNRGGKTKPGPAKARPKQAGLSEAANLFHSMMSKPPAKRMRSRGGAVTDMDPPKPSVPRRRGPSKRARGESEGK